MLNRPKYYNNLIPKQIVGNLGHLNSFLKSFKVQNAKVPSGHHFPSINFHYMSIK
jgi:hypothetical protein